jgi:hypothetical protein
MQRVNGESLPYPEKATLLGPCQVIPREYPNITCQIIDLSMLETKKLNPARVGQLVAALMTEIGTAPTELVVAYRAGKRWVRRFEPARVIQPAKNRVRERGVYLITGGLGGIGLVMANYLAQTAKARLVLISRAGLPPREEWSKRLELPGLVSEQIQRCRQWKRWEQRCCPLLPM